MTPRGRSCGQSRSSGASSLAELVRRDRARSRRRAPRRLGRAGASPRARARWRASAGKSAPGAVELRQRLAEAGAMERLDSPRPHAVEEADDRRRPAAELAQRLAVACRGSASGRRCPCRPDGPAARGRTADRPGRPAFRRASGCRCRARCAAGSWSSRPPRRCPCTRAARPGRSRPRRPSARRRERRYRQPSFPVAGVAQRPTLVPRHASHKVRAASRLPPRAKQANTIQRARNSI